MRDVRLKQTHVRLHCSYRSCLCVCAGLGRTARCLHAVSVCVEGGSACVCEEGGREGGGGGGSKFKRE